MRYFKAVLFIVTFLFIMLLPIPAAAHPGRTDANGGHTDTKTGVYHYHSSATDAVANQPANIQLLEVTTVIYIFIAVFGTGVVIVIGTKTVKKKRKAQL